MTTVNVAIAVTYTSEVFPAGSGPITSVTATLTGSAAGNTTPQKFTVTASETSLTIPLLADTYTWTLVNADAAGNSYGGPYTGTLVVSATATVTLNLATGLSIA
jgi:hypothetical protein